MKVINNPLIKDITTYKLSGISRKLIIPENTIELKNIINGLKNDKYKIIGKGSNLIISESYDGILIRLDDFKDVKFNNNIVTVGAGMSLSKFVRLCAEKSLSGLEFACGIPGTVGGAVYMNAGAYGKEIKDVLKEITVLDENGKIKTISDLKLNYRDSILKHKKYVCLDATFKLRYGDSISIKKEINEIMKSRREKQPLDYPSAGSVFKNPKGHSIGEIIEKLGLKGLRFGGAEVSKKHANFIINKGDASAEEVIKLIRIIESKLKECGIDAELEQEILKG